MEGTKRLRAALPHVFKAYNVRTFLDAPCGDWFWMQHVDLGDVQYIGGDISSEIIAKLNQSFGSDQRSFVHLDITSDPLPKADMIMVRDCLFHLRFWLRWAFFSNFVNSGIPYLMTTVSYPLENKNLRVNGEWARFNPMLPPFSLSDPLELIHETADDLSMNWSDIHQSPHARSSRSLGIWHRNQVADAINSRNTQNTG
ncbi:MAG: hypothetical protein AAF755_05705 [Pseudomonadota bacterium]